MKATLRLLKKSRGFSLIEVSAALVVVGLLAFAFWKFFPQMRAIDETQPVERQLALADEVIRGFVLKNHRLPCADTDNDGKENCEAIGMAGDLPWLTLGVGVSARLRYGAYQSTDDAKTLTALAARHRPVMPPSPSGSTEWPLIADGSFAPEAPAPVSPQLLPFVTLARDSAPFSAVSPVNGLDFCAALIEAQTYHAAPQTGAFVTSNGVPTAYVVAHPGARNADGAGDLFDGTNGAGLNFESPDKPASEAYDDRTLAVGFGELASRLSCPAVLSRANAAGHMAVAAYDHYRFALAHLQVRAFLVDMAYYDAQAAYSALVMAAVDLADLVLARTMVTIGDAIQLADEVTVAVVFATVINSLSTVGGVAAGIYAVVTANTALDTAIDFLTKDAIPLRIEAEVHARRMLAVADETARYAVQLDAKGLMP